MQKFDCKIRDAIPEEFERIGKLLVDVYSNLEGFPGIDEQPNYYTLLANIGSLTNNPGTRLLIALSDKNEIYGTVVYFSDMKYYGSGGTAPSEMNAGGFRLLAVDHKARGKGVGAALTWKCIDIAKSEGQSQVIIHSTKSMRIAWSMYERIGFIRSEDLDFQQEKLSVFGFRLVI